MIYLFFLCLYFLWLATQNFLLPWIYQQEMLPAATVGLLMASKEAMLALALVLLAGRAFRRGWRFCGADKFALAYTGLLVVYVFAGPALLGGQATWTMRLISLRSTLTLVLFYFWGRLTFLTLRELRRFLWFVLGLQVAVALFGMYEWFFLPSSFWRDTIGAGRFMLDVKGLLNGYNVIDDLPANMFHFGLRRAMSTYAEPLALGLASVFPLLLGLALVSRNRPRAISPGSRWLLWAATTVIAIGLLLTIGRESIAAAILGALALLWWTGQLRRALAPALMVLVVLSLTPQVWHYVDQTITFKESSAAMHLNLLQSGWKQIPNLLLGKGLGEAGVWALSIAGAHPDTGENSYLELMEQTGILGVVLLCGFLFTLARSALQRSRTFPDPLISCALLAAAAHILARSATAVFSPSLFGVVPLASFFFLCGALFTTIDHVTARPHVTARRILILRQVEAARSA